MTYQDRLETDVIVIGAGPAGENVAGRAIKGGLSAIIVEHHLVGGECSYYACMPSKALLRSSSAVAAASRVDGAKQALTGRVDADATLARRTSFTSNWDDSGQVSWLDGLNIQLVRGTGRISGEREVTVRTDEGDTTISARHAVVIATGSRPVMPSIPGLSEIQPWTNREATSAQSVPGRLVVLGGGVAGIELAQAFARLGSRVTVLARHGILGLFPDKVGEMVGQALEGDGIDLRVNTEAQRFDHLEDGPIRVTLANGETIETEVVLVSTGRQPNVDDVGLEVVDVDAESFSIADDGRISGPPANWLYAVGDAAGKVLLTHQGKYEARVTGDAIVARAVGHLQDHVEPWSPYAATADKVAVPQVVYTDPEVAMVGRSAEQAAEAGIRTRVVERAIDVAGASLHADGYEGWVQMVVDEDRSVIVGLTFVGQDVSELLHAATIAIVGEVPLQRLWHAVPAYPAMSEIWLRLLEDYGL